MYVKVYIFVLTSFLKIVDMWCEYIVYITKSVGIYINLSKYWLNLFVPVYLFWEAGETWICSMSLRQLK